MRRLEPRIIGLVQELVTSGSLVVTGAGGGGGSVAQHALFSSAHSGTLDRSQAPWVETDIDSNIAAHAALPDVHHNRVTVASPSGLLLSGQQLSLDDSVAGGGLVISAKVISLGTPSDISAQSASSVTANNHGHAVIASANPGANERLLKSTTAGGLTLESENINGALVVGQSITGADTAFRVIYHTHDYPHAHVVVNPGGFWNLDEQFGVDIDDNLLVRGWIVGKHAIQLPGAVMILHFDGPQPFETNFKGETSGHMGQVGTPTGGLIFRPGKFDSKAAQIAEDTTNLVQNPSFETGTTNWSSGGGGGAIAVSTERSYAGLQSAKISTSGAGNGIYRTVATWISLANGETLAAQCRAWSEVAAKSQLVIYDDTNTTIRATVTGALANEWEFLATTWTNSTGGTVDIRLYIYNLDGGATSDVWYDAIQAEKKVAPTPYCDGSLGENHSWSGTAHASASTRTLSTLTYAGSVMPLSDITIMAWVNTAGLKAANQYVIAASSTGNPVRLLINAAGRLAGVSGGVTITEAGTVMAGQWVHVALVISGTTSTLYKNGALAATGSGGPLTDCSELRIGSLPGSNTNHLNGWIDDVVIANRAVTADEIRAIYESNAPVFAETSTWHFRSGRNRVWADAEGLWVLSSTGGVVFGVYAGDESDSGSKSWGGITLAANDLLIGDDSRGGYVWWDDSAATVKVVGQITVVAGSSGIGTFSDAGGLATADDLDDVPDGSTYGRVRSTIIGGGYIRVGSGTKDSTLDGWYIDGTEIVGQLDGVDQVVLDTNGKVKAGPSGSTVLDADGIDIAISATFDVQRAYTFNLSGVEQGGVYAGATAGTASTQLYTGVANKDVFATVATLATGSTKTAETDITAIHNSRSGNPAYVRLVATDTDSWVYMVQSGIAFGEVDATPPAGFINIFMGGNGNLWCRFPNGTLREIAVD